ncbi:MAG: type I-C CRISPR-associated protein Cas8c/Csd1 [Planctomycetota bacterium]
MILRALHDLHERLKDDPDYEIAPDGFSYQKVTFVIVLETDGRLVEIADTQIEINGKTRPRRVLVFGTAKPSGKGLNPCFLWDNTKYILGHDGNVDPKKRKPERAQQVFEAFRERHISLRKKIGSSEFDAVCNFLSGWKPSDAEKHSVLAEGTSGFGVFQIRGQTHFVHETQKIRTFWLQDRQEDPEGPLSTCLITGEVSPTARIHPKIKGVWGAQSSGAAIVSFNDSSYLSYGKVQNFNAPVSSGAARHYVKALNALLDGPMQEKHRFGIGDMTLAFWTDRPSALEDIFVEFSQSGEGKAVESSQDEGLRSKIGALLRALRQGREAYADLDDEPDKTEYFLLGLSPNAARLSVRFFWRGNLTAFLDKLRLHFQHIQIETQRNSDREFPPAWQLLRQTARESKDIPPILAAPLLRAIIDGSNYPPAMYSAIIGRIRADRDINHARACLIKGYLIRNLGKDMPMSLDKSQIDSGYRLGRLFATLEKTQKDALGENLNATIRDRFYASASATPGPVIPRLLRTYQHHLAKLSGGLKVSRERLLQEIMDGLDQIPAQLDLSAQGCFALGYYHQMNDFYKRRTDDSKD